MTTEMTTETARVRVAAAALEFHLTAYRRTWRGSVFSSFLLPVLFLVSMGLTVGRYIDAGGNGLGVPYLDYIAPGVLAATALQVAVGEASWPVFDKFTWSRTYHAMRATPLTEGDIMRGHLAYVLLRVAIATTGFLIVLALFGAVHSAWVVAALPAALLIGLASAAPVFGFAATVRNDGMFAVLFRFAVIPMTLFAGVFFPVDGMPLAARLLAYVSPLWHGVELCRAATLGTPTAWGVTTHIGVLLVWAAAGYFYAWRRFVKRLGD
jgi:lipooligosaccharide transport system permease protein